MWFRVFEKITIILLKRMELVDAGYEIGKSWGELNRKVFSTHDQYAKEEYDTF